MANESRYLPHTLQFAEQFVSKYRGDQPLLAALRDHFRSFPKMGSKDRKRFTAVVMAWFRVSGKQEFDFSKAALWGLMLNSKLEPVYANAAAELLGLSDHAGIDSLSEAIPWEEAKFFPAFEEISGELDRVAVVRACLTQPAVFIRLVRGREKEVVDELAEKGWAYETINAQLISFQQHYPLHDLHTARSGAFEVQDIASIESGEWFDPQDGQKWFDACAGSGGKSLLLLDKNPQIQLTVNDKRPEILDELQQRFGRGGWKVPKVMQADLSLGIYEGLGPFDGIIADLPCSGSGTWGRSPERIRLFEPTEIDRLAALQRDIIKQLAKVLDEKGKLYYITCSVYARENEGNIAMLCEELTLQCNRKKYCEGYQHGGDTLFVAELVRP